MKIILVITTALWCVSVLSDVNATVIKPRGPVQESSLEPFNPAGEQLEIKRERRQDRTATLVDTFEFGNTTHEVLAGASAFSIRSTINLLTGTDPQVIVTGAPINTSQTFTYAVLPDRSGFNYLLEGTRPRTPHVVSFTVDKIEVNTGEPLATASWTSEEMILRGYETFCTVTPTDPNVIDNVSEGQKFVQGTVGTPILNFLFDYTKVFAEDPTVSGQPNGGHGHGNPNPGLGPLNAAAQGLLNGVGLMP